MRCREGSVRRLNYRVGHVRRQARDALGLAALQLEGRHAICECHVAVLTVDRRVAKRYRELEFPVGIGCQVGLDRLGHFQVARLTGVRERCGRFRRADRPFIARLSGRESVSLFLDYRVGHVRRQAFRRRGLAALQLEGRYAVRKCHVAVLTVDRCVAKRYREGELPFSIGCQVGHHRLGHVQVANFTSVREGCGRLRRADRPFIACLSGREIFVRRLNYGIG